MGAPLDRSIYIQIAALLSLLWRHEVIADHCHVSLSTVYRIEAIMLSYGSPSRPASHARGAPRKITRDAAEKLRQHIEENPWIYQAEMAWFLWEECGIECSQPTIHRVVRRLGLSVKKGERRSKNQNPELRAAWRADMLSLPAEKLVFVDESSFNQTTGWRRRAYAPIGQAARYDADIRRGTSWSVLPALTSIGYLSCTGIKKGYYNTEEFLQWIVF